MFTLTLLFSVHLVPSRSLSSFFLFSGPACLWNDVIAIRTFFVGMSGKGGTLVTNHSP